MPQNTIVKGVGLALVFANWVMAGWAIAWVSGYHVQSRFVSFNLFQVFEGFLASTILLGILTLLLIYSNVVLIVYHVPTWYRPLDLAFIHAPVRLFLILPLSVLFPYSLLFVIFPPIRTGWSLIITFQHHTWSWMGPYTPRS
jgi:hypothetical protein